MLRKSATAAEDELAGTYKLISTTETILETGQAVLMKHRGSIMYGRDGRVLVVIVTGNRPKPEPPASPYAIMRRARLPRREQWARQG